MIDENCCDMEKLMKFAQELSAEERQAMHEILYQLDGHKNDMMRKDVKEMLSKELGEDEPDMMPGMEGKSYD